MKKLTAILLPFVLASCSDGSTFLASDDPVANGTCGTTYYQELNGNYDGQIDYQSAEVFCSWEVSLQLAARNYQGLCQVDADMQSQLLQGDTDCADIDMVATLAEPFGSGLRRDQWTAPQWPVQATIYAAGNQLQGEAIRPVGMSGNAPLPVVSFDGRGNVTFPEHAGYDETYSGVLVKQ